jgi:hypothetical protein
MASPAADKDTALTTTVQLRLKNNIAGLPVELALAMSGPKAWQAEATIDVNQSLSEFVTKLYHQFVDPQATAGPFDAQTLPDIVLKRITVRYSGKPEFFMISGELDQASLLFATYSGAPDASAGNGAQGGTAGQSRRYILGLRWQPSLRLADLAKSDVLGSVLDQLTLSQVSVFYTNQPFADRLFPDDPDPTTLGAGISFATRLGTATDLVIPPPPATSASKAGALNTPEAGVTSLVRPAVSSATTGTPKPAPNTGMRFWFKVQKNFGPLQVQRVGCEWKDGKIGLLLDAAVDVGGLHFGLTGLSVRLPPSDPKLENLELGLDGLDLSYRGGPISISGSFLKSEITVQGQKTIQYDGMAMIQAENFAIIGFGSYASVDGRASLYIFAILHMELGGPPCFRVNGLAAGFGYNRKLTLPPIEEVYNFPLVRAALDANYFGSGPDKSIQTAMRTLQKFIPPSLGDYWFAIGIRFSSFEMIQAFALLSVSFGNEVEIGLLGLAAVTIPRGVEPGKAIAYAELALRVVIKPAEGTIKMEARLTNESYVFDKDCHLTGGFAFYLWFGGPLAGDFVLTLGGYHPKFIRPSHYPIVPRLGINWQVSKEMTITAGMYFALTPSCLMVGGKLSAVYQSSSVKVWFIIYADFLLVWKPFYYSIDVGISLGIEVDLGATSIRIHLGAELHLWGPEFAGLVRIDLTVIIITVRFGPDKKSPEPLKAEEFVESFLPPPPNVIAIQINSGLMREEKKSDTVLRVVNGHGLALTTQSLIPVSEFTGLKPQDALTSSPPQLGIRSMGKIALGSSYKVTIRRVGESANSQDKRKNMRLLLVKTAVPDALWGKSCVAGEVALPQKPEAIMLQAWAGMRISFDPIAPQGALPAMAIEKFAYETFNRPIPWNDQLKVAETIAANDRKEIGTVMDRASTQNRDAMRAVLARKSPFALHTVDLTRLSQAGESYFQANPAICRLGSAFV